MAENARAARERRTSIATLCLSGTLEEKLAAAATAGFDGVEIAEPDLLASPLTPAAVRERCAALGLSIDLYQPFRDFDDRRPDRLAENLRRARRKFAVMAALGTDLMLLCSAVGPHAVVDDDELVVQLRVLADSAAAHGMRVAYEALAWGTHVSTWRHSWDVVRRVDHPALGLCLDSFHVYSRGSDPSGIRDVPGERIFFLQLADAPSLSMDVLQWSRHHRLFPGQGDFALAAFLRHVLDAGYRGPLSLEVFNDVFRQSDPGPTARDARRSLHALQDAARDQGPAGDPLPAPPRLHGVRTVELAADAASATELARTLAALGLARVGSPRAATRVARWVRGATEVRVRTVAGADGVAVVGLWVATDDPHAARRRADALAVPGDPAPALAPDGTRITFRPARPAPDADPFTVDHVGLTQPFDQFDEAVLFHRCVLGLTEEQAWEAAAPHGLVRTRALADPAGAVRVCLSAPRLRRGAWGPGVRAPQHVAFATDDALDLARRARRAGAPILAIPDNYYDDLESRLTLPPGLLPALRAHDVMLDRDDHGSFLHFFTRVIGERLFLEVVQRVDGYAGYGAPDEPISTAAHRNLRDAA